MCDFIAGEAAKELVPCCYAFYFLTIETFEKMCL